MIAIAAVCENGGIGRGGALLYPIRADLRRFRQLTMGKTLVMGRRTLESLPGGRGLPGRRNLVLSQDPAFHPEDAELLRSLDQVPADAVVIGGESVYRQLLPRCDRLYITRIFAAPEADAFFPTLGPEWRVEQSSEILTEDNLRFQYVDYVRV